MKQMWVGYNVGCIMGFLLAHNAWQIDQFPTCWPMNGLFVHLSRGWGVLSFSERLVCLSISVCSSDQVTNWPTDHCTDDQLAFRPSICLFVHPERFQGIFLRTHERSDLKFGMHMYPDHLQNWLDLGHSLLIFLFLAPFWLVKGEQRHISDALYQVLST